MSKVKGSQESLSGLITGAALVMGKKFLEDRVGDISLIKIFDFVNRARDSVNASLPNYVKRATVDSRVFITSDAVREECINDVLYADNALYIGWITSALAMNQHINGTKVRDILGVVATEGFYSTNFINTVDNAIDNIKTKNKTLGIFDTVNDTIDEYLPNKRDPNSKKFGQTPEAAGHQQQSIKDDFNLLGGTIVDVSFSLGDKQTLTIPVLVRLSPTIINNDVASQFLKTSFKPDFWTRWFKFRTGEISFFKDFLFEMDLRRDKQKALKNDRSNEIYEMMLKNQNALSSFIGKIFGWRSNRQNIANTIHIYTKRPFDMWCHDAGIDFKNYNSRQNFFNKTFSMMINVIDSDYNKVYTYINGLSNYSELTFSQLQNNRSKQQYDLTQIMRAFNTQSAPRY